MPQRTPDLNAFEASLRELAPSSGALDRERVLFDAGRASAPRGWAWPLATLLASTTAIALSAFLLRPPRVEVVERTVYVEVHARVPSPPTPVSPSSEAASEQPMPASPYHQLHEHLLRWGLDGLGDAPYRPARPVTIESLMN